MSGTGLVGEVPRGERKLYGFFLMCRPRNPVEPLPLMNPLRTGVVRLMNIELHDFVGGEVAGSLDVDRNIHCLALFYQGILRLQI